MEIGQEITGLQEKLRILADAAKYDVACTSSGQERKTGIHGKFRGCRYLSQLCIGRQVYFTSQDPFDESLHL